MGANSPTARILVVPVGPITTPPSSRPTIHLEVNEALAQESSYDFRPPPLGTVPIEMAVPRRSPFGSTEGLGHRAMFLLLHVDGSTSVAGIAKLAGLPMNDVSICFLELVESGLVEMDLARIDVEDDSPFSSGVFVKKW